MAKYYTLVPLPLGIFEGMALIDRAVFGLIWERYRLSCYKVAGGCEDWVDDEDGSVFCIFSHAEMAAQIGTSEKTIRRSLQVLRDEHCLIDWRKASFKGACRYYIEPAASDYMASLRQDNTSVSDCP